MRVSLRVFASAAVGLALLCTALLAAQYFHPSIAPRTTTVGPNGAPPSLGNYPDTSLPLSTDITVTPDAPPTNTTSITVATSTNFTGNLEGYPATGVIRITNAHPAGTYAITVTAFNAGGLTVTKTFMLTVTTPATCMPLDFTGVGIAGLQVNTPMAVGDFNGDGHQDIVATFSGVGSDPGHISISLGDGAGGFGPVNNFPAGSRPYFPVVGDFNGDGNQDLAVTSIGNVSILLGDGTGNFSAPTNYAVGNNPIHLAIGDFNSDGKQDLAVARDSNAASILFGDGMGHFTGPTNLPVGFAQSVAVGDFNQDGNQDLAFASPPVVSIFLGDGTGNFTGPTNYNGRFTSMVLGDFNGDGKQDLAGIHHGNSCISSGAVLLGDGAGHFGAPRSFDSGFGSWWLAAGDFNGDGKEDLAVVQSCSDPDQMVILLNDGAANFTIALSLTMGPPYSVAVGDFNGDGKQDLLVGNSHPSASVWLRTCGPTPTTITISGTVSYCSNPVPAPVTNVTLTLTGTAAGTTVSDSSGNYMFSVPSGGSYTVTPTKMALPPGSPGINTTDVVAVQRHFLNLGTPLSGCRLTAADVNGDSAINTVDVVAIQRFFLAQSPGTGKAGNYKFTPTNRTYQNITTNQTSQNYDTLVFGDVATPFVP